MSKILATLMGMVLNYMASRYWVFLYSYLAAQSVHYWL
ncbi:hypothetical protein Q0F98_34500 [Paenibacillus amylolyticus]|nr:hypothetical protein Q0F98_34500 [Paenibacillus amylolyticus]